MKDKRLAKSMNAKTKNLGLLSLPMRKLIPVMSVRVIGINYQVFTKIQNNKRVSLQIIKKFMNVFGTVTTCVNFGHTSSPP